MSATSSKSAQISALVQELQAGKITKAELFDKLQQLQRAAGTTNSASTTVVPTTTTVNSNNNNVNNTVKTTNIQPIAVVPPPVPTTTNVPKLDIDNSTVAQQQATYLAQQMFVPPPVLPSTANLPAMITINGTTMPLQQYIQQQQAIMANAILEATKQQSTASVTSSSSSVVPPIIPSSSSASSSFSSASSSSASASSVTDATLNQSYTRSQRYERAASRSSRNGSVSSNNNQDMSPSKHNLSIRRRSDASAPRTARKSIIGAGELEECTFRPKVNPLPAQYTIHQNGTPFQERVIAWERAKRDEVRRQADERNNRELEECTFQPTINHTSREVALARGHGRPGEDIHERLYKEHEKKANPGSSRYIVNNSTIGFATSLLNENAINKSSPNRGRSTSRLSLLSSGRPLFTSSATGSPLAPLDRNHINNAILTQEAQQLLTECTFAPHVNPVIDAKPVRSRYRDPSNQRSLSRPRPAPSGTEECTFKPKTNPVRPTAMPAAALYVQAPIYDRLARTQTRSQRQREAVVAKERSKLEHGDNDSQSQQSRSPSVDHSQSITSEQKEERAKRLTEFLLRQEEAVRKRHADIESMKEATAPTLQPALCEKSLRIVEERGMIPFLERISHDKLIKQQESHRNKALHSVDPECTFHPAINPTSRGLKARSVEELSRGDALKRETAARMVKLRLEQEDLGGVTFQPKINEKSKHTESRLRILADPDSYVQRLKQEAAVLAEKARRSNAEAEMMEMAECTFHPSVHPAPEYVSRIAASMSLARAVKPQPAPARPDWR